MKNLFYVHSHITYYVAKGVIKKLGLKKRDICFILSRNYKNKGLEEFETIDITRIHDDLDDFGLTNFYKKHKYISILDTLINKHVNANNFIVFLPHVFHPVMQIIATNENCYGVHILEEGVNAYSDYYMNFKEKSFIKSVIKKTINNVYFIGKNRIFYVKNFDLRKFKKAVPPKFYTITSKGFKGLPYTIEQVKMLPENNSSYNISGATIIVLEGAVEQGNLSLKAFLDGINTILENISAEEIYLKFHPAQNNSNRELIKTILKKKNFGVKVIPDTIAFEEIILTNKNLYVYGFTTSLLFYANEYNCEVKSFEETLLGDPLFKEFRSKNNFDLKRLLNES